MKKEINREIEEEIRNIRKKMMMRIREIKKIDIEEHIIGIKIEEEIKVKIREMKIEEEINE